MLRKRIRENLNTRIFLLTFFILLGAGCVTFGLIAWATPITYTAVVSDEIQLKLDHLKEILSDTDLDKSGEVLDTFIREAGVEVMLIGDDGQIVNTDSQLAIQSVYEDDSIVVSVSWSDEAGTVLETSGGEQRELVSVTSDTVISEVSFASGETCEMYVSPHIQTENQAVKALEKVAPGLLFALFSVSLLCAWMYSRYITKPIIQLNEIAGKMAKLEFHWQCEERRSDEIGLLGRSLNQMSQSLSAALIDLKRANESLRREVEREKELEQQRLAFFSSASHELKTPVTILKGQLAGMLDGIDVYQNRDKYLASSLQVTARMENLIQEILTISRVESVGNSEELKPLRLSEVVEAQLELDAGLLEQRGIRLITQLSPEVIIMGSRAMLAKVINNLISNAARYSPEHAEVRIRLEPSQERSVLTVENTGCYIREEAVAHLFEAFYREEQSRNRRTGGSGLGLYLVGRILTRHHASYRIENSEDGVKFTAIFPA